MRLTRIKRVFSFIIAILFVISCKEGSEKSEPLQITATINPYYLLTKEIVGERADVHLFIPANASPHTFSPKMSDLKKLENSALIIANGLHLEEQLYDKLGAVKDRLLIAGDVLPEHDLLANDPHHDEHQGDEENHHEGEEEHGHDEHHEDEEEHGHDEHHEGEEEHGHDEHHEGEEEHGHDEHHEGEEEHNHGPVDPHVWFDSDNLIAIAGAITEAVVKLDPASEEYYKGRLAKVVAGIGEVDSKIKAERAVYSEPAIITFHNSFGYFLSRYDIELVGVIEESPGSTPSPKTLIETGKKINGHGVNVIFIEPQLNPKGANIIAKEFGLAVDTLDPLGFSVNAESAADLLWNNWLIMKKYFK